MYGWCTSSNYLRLSQWFICFLSKRQIEPSSTISEILHKLLAVRRYIGDDSRLLNKILAACGEKQLTYFHFCVSKKLCRSSGWVILGRNILYLFQKTSSIWGVTGGKLSLTSNSALISLTVIIKAGCPHAKEDHQPNDWLLMPRFSCHTQKQHCKRGTTRQWLLYESLSSSPVISKQGYP